MFIGTTFSNRCTAVYVCVFVCLSVCVCVCVCVCVYNLCFPPSHPPSFSLPLSLCLPAPSSGGDSIVGSSYRAGSSSAGGREGGGGGKETERRGREDWGVDGGSVDMGVGNGAGHGIVPRVASPEVSLAFTSCDAGYSCCL